MTRYCLVMLLLCAATLGATPAWAASSLSADCFRLTEAPLDRDNDKTLRKQLDTWLETCRQASDADPTNTHLKVALSRAYWHAVDREASLLPLREAIAQGDTQAMLNLFNDFNSFDRHLGKPDLIPRAEAEQALRRAAELGNPDAIWRLATILNRGGPIKHDPAAARHWGERALANPPKAIDVGVFRVVVGHWLSQSDNANERKRGIALLEALPRRGDAQAYLAEAIRQDNPVRARALLEGVRRSYPGHALAPLCDMLIKGEGGPKDEKRALSLLRSAPNDAQHPKALLGQLMLEGRLVPRDVKTGVFLLIPWSQWDYDTRLQIVRLLAENPEVQVGSYADHFLYRAIEDAEMGEPGATDALIALKLSSHVQFADKAGGCALAERAAKAGDAVAARHVDECRAK